MSYCSRSCRRRLPYWTPEVEHLAAFAAIVTNILLRMRRNGYLGTSGKRFGDLATFFVDFCILHAECPPYFYFWFVWPTDLESIPHASTPRSIILTSFKLIWPHTAQLNRFCLLIRHVTFWPWPFDLEQLSYMAGHVPNLATKFEDPMTIRSWVTSYNGSHWLPLKMRTRPLLMRRVTWPENRGSKTITFLESPTPICLFTIQLLLGYDDDISSTSKHIANQKSSKHAYRVA